MKTVPKSLFIFVEKKKETKYYCRLMYVPLLCKLSCRVSLLEGYVFCLVFCLVFAIWQPCACACSSFQKRLAMI